MRRTLALAAPLTLLAPAASAQTCAELDINGCGCLNFIQFNAMIALVASGDPADSPSGNGDYDNDGDVDGADLAFWLANFVSCSSDIFAPTRTTYPETGTVSLVVRRTSPTGGAAAQHELLAQLESPLDEVIAVTRFELTGPDGTPAGFADPNQDGPTPSASPLGQPAYDTLGIDADTYVAIGDRTDEPSPYMPLVLDLDAQAFADRTAIRSTIGWHTDFLNTGTPTVSGAGGAAGNTDNEVLLLGFTRDTYQYYDVDIEFAVATADGRMLITSRRFRIGPECPADTNYDGIVSPADFNAWIVAFNTGDPRCDQNRDTLCSPADFNAWILNFNTGCS